jgi:hypothetical protein
VVKHRAEIAHVEPAFKEVKLNPLAHFEFRSRLLWINGPLSNADIKFTISYSLREESNSRTTCRLSAVNRPMRACISGPRSSAAINGASIAACHSSDCRVLPGGKAKMYLAASLSVRSVLPRGNGIGSSNARDQGIISAVFSTAS